MLSFKRLKSTGILLLLAIILISAFNMQSYVYALDSAVTILPSPPINAAAVNSAPTEVTLSWDASPNSPSSIASYTIFYKESTNPTYPLTPQITRTDSLPSYSETIAVTSGVAYDFIIYTNANSGAVSPEDCASCKASNSPLCGNAAIDAGEDCDGVEFGGALCTDYGYISGTMSCTADCSHSFVSCYSGSSGGGGDDDGDTTDPNPGTAESPEYSNGPTIPVTYSGAYDSGGSGFSYVKLLYKKGTQSWRGTDLNSSAASGSFDFTPDSSLNANYYFSLQAYDNDGNTSSWPSGSGDTNTIYDIEPPSIGSITVPETAISLPIIITYQDAADEGIAGLDHIKLWYKKGLDGTWIDSELTETGAVGSFDFEPTDGSGHYYIDLIALDRAGNKSVEVSEHESAIIFDEDSPVIGTVSADETATELPISITYAGAVDIGPAGLDHVELWYKKEVDGPWTNSLFSSTESDDVFEFMATPGEGTYYFDLVLEDSFGNRSVEASHNGLVSVEYIPEPDTPPPPPAEAPTAILSNLPAEESTSTTASITVAGQGVVTYRFKLDSGVYGSGIPITNTIDLSSLAVGEHSISVIARNAEGTWQPEASSTNYTWTIFTPETVLPSIAILSNLPDAETELTTASIIVAGEGVVAYKYKLDAAAYGSETAVQNNINLANLSVGEHTISVIAKNAEEIWQPIGSPTTYSWEVLSIPVIIPHCENEIIDGDELGVDCGGSVCPVCIDVTLSVLTQPMGRTPGVFESSGSVNLYSSKSGKLIKSEQILMSNDGKGQSLIRQIPANTYYIGLKSSSYLQKLIANILLEEDESITILDFTFGGTFLLIGGDVFNDNIINSFDLALMVKNYQKADDNLDMNRDGFANAADLAMILKNYQLVGDSL